MLPHQRRICLVGFTRTIVQLIAATTTAIGLTVSGEIDTSKYPRGIKVPNAEIAALNLFRHALYRDGITRSHFVPESLQENELTDLFMDRPKALKGAAYSAR
jgi:Rhodopirellula transposase DDE domain